jgi:hypothetical protein
MLRWTNRLKDILIEEGGIDFPVEDWDPDFDFDSAEARFREIREAEFIPQSAPPAVRRSSRTSSKRQKIAVAEGGDTALEHEFPPDFRWHELVKWLSPPFCEVERLEVVPFGCREKKAETRPCPFDDHCIDILWVSPEEFVSFSKITYCRHHYSVKLRGMEWFSKLASPVFYAYHRATFDYYDELEYEAVPPHGPCPEAPFRFIRHLVAPHAMDMSSYVCEFNVRTVEACTPTMYTSFFSLASDFDHNRREILFTLSGCLLQDPLRELMTYQFHPAVRLAFHAPDSENDEPDSENDEPGPGDIEYPEDSVPSVSKEELEEIVRGLQHLSRWPVGEIYFAPSSRAKSVQLVRQRDEPDWPTAVTAISLNRHIEKLTVRFTNDNSLDDIALLVKTVLTGHDSLNQLCMTVEAVSGNEKAFFEKLTEKISAQTSSEQSSPDLVSGSAPTDWGTFQVGLKYFGLSFIACPSGGSVLFTSNRYWDTVVSPHLVHNWFHLPQEPPSSLIPALLSTELVGIAVKAVNQGLAYRKTTDLVARHLSTSSSGVLFRLFRRNLVSLAEMQEQNMSGR